MTDVQERTDQSQDTPRRQRPRSWLAVSVVAVLLALVAGTAIWGADQRRDATALRDERDRQREAVLMAGGFVEALLSYDHEDLDAQQAAVERFATERFRAEYLDAFTGEIREQIVAEEASSTVTVRDVYVTSDEGEERRAMVHARSQISSGVGASAELESYLQVTLVRVDDRWQVDELTSLGSRDLSAPLTGSAGTESEAETDG